MHLRMLTSNLDSSTCTVKKILHFNLQHSDVENQTSN